MESPANPGRFSFQAEEIPAEAVLDESLEDERVLLLVPSPSDEFLGARFVVFVGSARILLLLLARRDQ